MPKDEAFLSLLSSQRELLNQLNMEANMRRNDPGGRTDLIGPPIMTGYGADRGSYYSQQITGDFYLPQWNLVSNTPIVGRPSSDFIVSKRLSMGLGMGMEAYSLPSFQDTGLELSTHSVDKKQSSSNKKRDKATGDRESSMKRKKRRLSSLGFLSSSFFDDHLQPGRRESLTLIFGSKVEPPVIAEPEIEEEPEVVVVDGDADSDDEPDVTGSESESAFDSKDVDKPKIDPGKVKRVMMAFNKAMEFSQKSQQSIHDWDRKMGLKRSHSKTMRLSARSRKKLRSILKKEIIFLASTNLKGDNTSDF